MRPARHLLPLATIRHLNKAKVKPRICSSLDRPVTACGKTCGKRTMFGKVASVVWRSTETSTPSTAVELWNQGGALILACVLTPHTDPYSCPIPLKAPRCYIHPHRFLKIGRLQCDTLTRSTTSSNLHLIRGNTSLLVNSVLSLLMMRLTQK